LKYLPVNYHQYENTLEKTGATQQNAAADMDGGANKRAKITDAAESMANESMTTGCFEDNLNKNSKITMDDQSLIAKNQLMTVIDDEIFFTSKFPIRMDLKQINVVSIANIDAVLVSTFQELYGLPYLISDNKNFKGKIYMTLAMAQIGRSLLLEFVNMCETRNNESI
jgi:hypothetical protein